MRGMFCSGHWVHPFCSGKFTVGSVCRGLITFWKGNGCLRFFGVILGL